METTVNSAYFLKSALIIVDMQNDFVHPEGYFGHRAREAPEAGIDMAFLSGSVLPTTRLAAAFRSAGRPVLYLAHVVKPDYSDAQFPYWRLGLPTGGNRTFIVEGNWGARIVDTLEPEVGEHLIVKKGFGGFTNTPLDTILRNMGVTTCVVSGVTTCVCVSTTIRGGVEYNYRMVLAQDAAADRSRDIHEAETRILARAFADIMTVDEIAETLPRASAQGR